MTQNEKGIMQDSLLGAFVDQALSEMDPFGRPLHEIVLIPNGSTDDTEAVCANLAATIADVRSEPAPRGGWGHAVRHGISKAKGDLICYTNSARTAASGSGPFEAASR